MADNDNSDVIRYWGQSLTDTLEQQGGIVRMATDAVDHNLQESQRTGVNGAWDGVLSFINRIIDFFQKLLAPDTWAAEHGMVTQINHASGFDAIQEHAAGMTGLTDGLREQTRAALRSFVAGGGMMNLGPMPSERNAALQAAITLHTNIVSDVTSRYITAYGAQYRSLGGDAAQQLQDQATAYAQAVASAVTGLPGNIDNSAASLAVLPEPQHGFAAMLLHTQNAVKGTEHPRGFYHEADVQALDIDQAAITAIPAPGPQASASGLPAHVQGQANEVAASAVAGGENADLAENQTPTPLAPVRRSLPIFSAQPGQ